MNETIFLTPKQVSEYLYIHLRTLQRLSKQGKIKAIKVGNRWRYLRKDIEAFASRFNISENKEFLTAIQVSRQLKLQQGTIYRLSKQGKIKSYKVGGRWRYLKEDIEKYSSYNTDFSNEPIRKLIPYEIASLPSVARNDRLGFNELRAYPRINCRIDCQYLINLTNLSGSGVIKNISAGGAFFAVASDLIEIGDPVVLRFAIGGQMDLNGRVVRKDNAGLGIKFRNISNEYKERIAEYVG